MSTPPSKSEFLQPTQIAVADLIKDDKVAILFANTFQCGFSVSDANIILMYNNAPLALLTMGLPAVRSLKNQLEQLLSLYEKNTKQSVLSIEELVQIIQENASTTK